MILQSDALPAISPSRYRSGYWATVFAFAVLLAFSTLPSPLYGIYATRDGFSSLMITVVYAAYAIGVMVSLFFAGHLSDSYGRRPVLLAALALDIGSAAVFLGWPSLAGLLVAGGAIIGGGGAAGFKGTLGTVAEISGPGKMAEALAGYFLACYVGLSVPVIGLGIALQSVSTRAALLGFASVIAAALLAAAPVLLGRRAS